MPRVSMRRAWRWLVFSRSTGRGTKPVSITGRMPNSPTAKSSSAMASSGVNMGMMATGMRRSL